MDGVPATTSDDLPAAQAPATVAAGRMTVWRHSFRRLWVPHSSFHSASHAAGPRRRNRLAPRPYLTCPNAGSTVSFRLAWHALPSSLVSLAVIAARSPSLRDSDGRPSLRGLP